MVTETKAKGLHAKLAEVMAEAERIPKNGKAPAAMGGFPFVQVGDAADFIRKALGSRGVSMLPTTVEIVGQKEHATKSGGTMTTAELRITWTLTDGETGDAASFQSYGVGADTGDKYSGKATTTAMKYALLSGFQLSTGDDVETADTSDRRPRRDAGFVYDQPQRSVGSYEEPPERPELERVADGLIGTVEVGKSPVDMNLRGTPDGSAWGFKLKNGRRSYQVLARGDLADALSVVGGGLTGQRVEVWGSIDMIPWDKDGKPMPPYPRVMLHRIKTDEWTLPAPTEDKPPEQAVVDANPTGVSPVRGQTGFDLVESARLDAEEAARAQP